MKYEQLTDSQKAIVDMEIPAELEKEANEKVALAQDLYESGFAKLAAETADELDKVAEEEEKEEKEEKAEEKLDDGEKKEAAVRGAFIARGYIDGLKKLGSERHDDELHYLYPFLAEKIANATGQAPGKVMAFLKNMKGKASGAMAGAKAKGSAAMGKGKEMAGKGKEKAMAAAKKTKEHVGKHKGAYGLAAGAAAGGAGGYAAGKHSRD